MTTIRLRPHTIAVLHCEWYRVTRAGVIRIEPTRRRRSAAWFDLRTRKRLR